MQLNNNILDSRIHSVQEYKIGNGIYNVNRVFESGKTIKEILLEKITYKKDLSINWTVR